MGKAFKFWLCEIIGEQSGMAQPIYVFQMTQKGDECNEELVDMPKEAV